MRRDPRPDEVRELVLATFERLDIYVDDPWDVDETILIDGGRYSARSYRYDGYMAMWLLSIGIVQFYDDEGNMLCTVNLSDEYEPQRMAA